MVEYCAPMAGQVVMTAGAKDAVLASVVNNTGVIEARTVEDHAGTIILLGGMSAGTVNVGGTLDASAADAAAGGRIETSGARVSVADGARVTTASADGLYGSWLIDPQDFTVASSGGDITGAALSAELGTTSVTLQSSAGHAVGSGDVNIDAAVAWSADTRLTLTAANSVNVAANITATGTNAGLAINPNTANGAAAAGTAGAFNLQSGAVINLPNVSPTSTTALVIGGTSYTVINTLGLAGSTTGTDLQGIEGNVSGHYALGSNIDATATSGWNAGAGFAPLGSGAFFTGTLEGLGHSVSNLTIDRPATNDVGLIGFSGPLSVIRDIGLVGGSVTGGNYVGALVGYNAGGAISQTYATGSVHGGNYVGGLVGFNYGNYQAIGTISDSHSSARVSGANDVGGLLGANGGEYGASLARSYATGDVSGAGNVGGLVGYNGGGAFDSFGYGTVGTVTFGHASGHVSGTADNVGGLVGLNGGTVTSSYALGAVGGQNYVGGLVGYNGGASGNFKSDGSIGAVTDSYASGAVAGASNVGGLVGYNGGGNGNYGTVGTIKTSYATGSVTGGSFVGGLVGYDTGSFTTISTTYATGAVSGTNSVGGLIGFSGGAPSSSFWDVTTSGQANSSGGTGMTTSQMQIAANFTQATAANGNVDPNWDFSKTWTLYEGHTAPLLVSFLTPLTVTANSGTATYTGSAYAGSNGVSYSSTPNANLLGGLTYTAGPRAAVNVGSYVVTPGGLYSNQQGYLLTFDPGTLAVKQLGSVAWTGGKTGDWSNAANWAGGAIPDHANVAAVTIPSGVTVTYDAAVPGVTSLSSLSNGGNLVMAAGTLNTSGSLTTHGYQQSGGVLDVGGRLTIDSTQGGVTLGNVDAGSLVIVSRAGRRHAAGRLRARRHRHGQHCRRQRRERCGRRRLRRHAGERGQQLRQFRRHVRVERRPGRWHGRTAARLHAGARHFRRGVPWGRHQPGAGLPVGRRRFGEFPRRTTGSKARATCAMTSRSPTPPTRSRRPLRRPVRTSPWWTRAGCCSGIPAPPAI